MFNPNMELRNLPASTLSNVANILEINKDWEKVVPLIPKDIQSPNFERKYNWEQIQLIESHAIKVSRPYAEVLFEEWGTSGRVRPTLGYLMTILEQAHIYRAADEVARLIGEPPRPRPLVGPYAPITTSLTDILNDESVEQKLNLMDTISSGNLCESSQDNSLCNRPTIQMKEPSDLIIFSDSVPINISDMIRFPISQSIASNSENIPNITALLGERVSLNNSEVSPLPSETDSIDNTVSNTTSSSSQNDLSRFIPDLHQVSSTSNKDYDIYDIMDKAILQDEKLKKFDYKDLESITNKFSGTLIEKPEGHVGKIGSGGFGDVYAGIHKNLGPLAVKKVRLNALADGGLDLDVVMKIFNTEVKSLSYLRHQNIVPIIGYSIDGPRPCLVCEYISGGSLLQKIADKVLSEQQRYGILRGTAEGLKYIHQRENPQQVDECDTRSQLQKKSYHLHGDVKSANILLTKEYVPKLCDFGLAKQLNTTVITRSVMGTSAYMPPEGFSGTITQKNDIFSFGIVMLEILTGLKPIVTTSGGNTNIKEYIEDNSNDGDITPLLDPVATWTLVDVGKALAQEVYDLANNCLQQDKKCRPTIDYVCDTLNDISNRQC